MNHECGLTEGRKNSCEKLLVQKKPDRGYRTPIYIHMYKASYPSKHTRRWATYDGSEEGCINHEDYCTVAHTTVLPRSPVTDSSLRHVRKPLSEP